MLTHVAFRSEMFPPDDDEAELLNPGIHGRRLANFLARGLRAQGFVCGLPQPEEWGWRIPIRNDTFALWIGCGNDPDETEGYRCFIEPHMPVIRKLFARIDARPRVDALQKALDTILSVRPLIGDKRWRTHPDFDALPVEPETVAPPKPSAPRKGRKSARPAIPGTESDGGQL